MHDFFINLSQYYLLLSLLSFVIVLIDLFRRPQSMKIMNLVWAITCIWAGILGLILYFCIGREPKMAMPKMDMSDMDMSDMDMSKMKHTGSIFKSATLSTLHCGAGCTLADIIGESATISMNIPIFYQWGIDYVLALIFGFAFQYIAIIEMNKIPFKEAISKAIKADFLSLTSWQIGMYSFMGYALFFAFRDTQIAKFSAEFCFSMQLAMLTGFIFSYPINILLIKLKIKSAM